MKNKFCLFPVKRRIALLLLVVGVLLGCSARHPGEMDTPQPQQQVVEVQTLSGNVNVENGIYDLEFYVRGTDDAVLVVSAGELTSAVSLSETLWKHAFVRGIEVTGGTLSLDAKVIESGAKYELKAAYLKAVSEKRPFIKGGDFSMITQVENNGGAYSDMSGNAGDPFVLSAQNGMNLARLRLYNDPGNADYYPSNQMYKGVQDEANILALAKRAKEAGMEIELTFHYSDYWTNGAEQYKPHEWKNYTNEQLHEAMYSYTKSFLEKMVAQGTAPQYVSLGNEIQSGILFDRIEDGESAPRDSASGYCDDMNNLAALLAQGSKAVREVCPEAKIILHLTTSESIDEGTYKWFLSAMRNNNLDYDVIGASYYPFYGNRTIEEMITFANNLTAFYDKDFIFMEVGFAWAETLADGSLGQIADNKPYENMTEEAQREFMLSLSEQIKVNGDRIIGYIYWDPVYIAAPNCGWKQGEKNVTGNSTLFDFSGKMLPAWEAIKYN